MKRMLTILIIGAALPTLAACGDRSGNKAAAEDLNRVAVAPENQSEVVPAEPSGNAQTPPANAAEIDAAQPADARPGDPRGQAAPAERRDIRPKAEPPAANVHEAHGTNPHAGHDMGNMADTAH